jgi:hypothetical protein
MTDGQEKGFADELDPGPPPRNGVMCIRRRPSRGAIAVARAGEKFDGAMAGAIAATTAGAVAWADTGSSASTGTTLAATATPAAGTAVHGELHQVA